MILTHFNYDTIKVTYDEPVDGPGRNEHNCKEEIWKNAQVHFKHDAVTGISTLELHGERDRFILLGSAKVIELVRDKSFCRGPYERKTVSKGTMVEVRRVEPIYNDHGFFCRFWYHLKVGGWDPYTTIAEEDEIQKPNILDRLANL